MLLKITGVTIIICLINYCDLSCVRDRWLLLQHVYKSRHGHMYWNSLCEAWWPRWVCVCNYNSRAYKFTYQWLNIVVSDKTSRGPLLKISTIKHTAKAASYHIAIYHKLVEEQKVLWVEVHMKILSLKIMYVAMHWVKSSLFIKIFQNFREI